jgi:hypothetical protein
MIWWKIMPADGTVAAIRPRLRHIQLAARKRSYTISDAPARGRDFRNWLIRDAPILAHRAAAVITAELVVGFEFRNDWTISDYPVEGGIFESYDKVFLPYLAKVRFASGSSVNRLTFGD